MPAEIIPVRIFWEAMLYKAIEKLSYGRIDESQCKSDLMRLGMNEEQATAFMEGDTI